MATLDIVTLVILGIAAVWGYAKGFISQLGGLAAIIIGVIACRMLGPQAVDLMAPPPATGDSLNRWGIVIMVYAVIYLVGYYGVILVAKLLKLAVHTVFLGPLDRIGGALFNVAKVLIVVSFALNIYVSLSGKEVKATGSIFDGKGLEYVMAIAPKIVGAVVPGD